MYLYKNKQFEMTLPEGWRIPGFIQRVFRNLVVINGSGRVMRPSD